MFIFLPPKIVPFIRHCGKARYTRRGHRRQCNTAHSHCMLGNQGYRHTFRKHFL